MAHIETLIEDIYNLLEKGFVGSSEWTDILGSKLAQEVALKFLPDDGAPGYLRPSVLGDPCDRKLWLSSHRQETKEVLPAPARMKFLYGNILEGIVLALAEVAGHTVRDQQREVTLHGVTGHIDGIVDDVLVDVKSASSIAFLKFSNHLTPDKDSFNYLTQIGFYLEALQSDPEIDHDRCAFLAIDKTLGKMVLDVHRREDLAQDWQANIEWKRQVLDDPVMPRRGFLPEADGKAGNMKLGLECSYCPFKAECWPGLRVFAYASGPRYLTHVAKVPDVPEVT